MTRNMDVTPLVSRRNGRRRGSEISDLPVPLQHSTPRKKGGTA
jgi:hypothetical protein